VRMVSVHGQILHASAPLPSFEVVSIRPWKPLPGAPPPPPGNTIASQKSHERIFPIGGGGQATDRVRMILPTQLLIASAFGLPVGFEKHILGGADWLSSDQYEIQARIEDSLFVAMKTMTPAQQQEQVALMEQSLLADRFKMKVHFETREMPVLALVVAKGGPKLAPAKVGQSPRLALADIGGALQMTATAVSIDTWIHSPFLAGRIVVDQTGLQGLYDFQLTWRPPQSDAEQEGGGELPLQTAIQEQLGLKLVPSKASVEVIVIDHIERPSEN
jgi:bla regulator protein BlaR1